MKKLRALIKMLFPNCLPAGFIVVLAALGPNQIQAQTIDWKVKEPFRFIKYNDQNSHWKIPSDKTAREFVEGLMSTSDRTNLPPFKETQYIRSENGGQRTLFSPDYVFPKVVAVEAWILSPPAGVCNWEYQRQNGKFNCKERFEFMARTQLGEGISTLTVTLPSGEPIDPIDVLVTDRLVLGLGDSFASGQGNPDKPAEADPVKLKGLANKNQNRIINGRWMKIENANVNWLKSKAEWLDNQCHRSLFSQHVLAAMRLASTNLKESVTLLPLACSGAEVLDGLLIPQKEPPFGKAPVADSQVNAAIRHLCPSGQFLPPVKKIFHRGFSGSDALKPEVQELLRCEGKVRKPDAILLSIGGNDVGFAPALVWAAIPDKWRNPLGWIGVRLAEGIVKPVCPTDSTAGRCKRNRPSANHRISKWLPRYYEYLMDELEDSELVSDPGRIFLTEYPDPTLKDPVKNTFCDSLSTADAVEQIRTSMPSILAPRKWGLSINETEMKELSFGLIQPLSAAMNTAATKYKWTLINGHLGEIKNHGLCADYTRTETDPVLYPHFRTDRWHPRSPDLEWAYDTERKRWFRNTNDSILFQFDDTNGSIKGSFHPDFRAHAVMADHVFLAVSSWWRDERR